jgi:hypothetical protein
MPTSLNCQEFNTMHDSNFLTLWNVKFSPKFQINSVFQNSNEILDLYPGNSFPHISIDIFAFDMQAQALPLDVHTYSVS